MRCLSINVSFVLNKSNYLYKHSDQSILPTAATSGWILISCTIVYKTDPLLQCSTVLCCTITLTPSSFTEFFHRYDSWNSFNVMFMIP